MPVNLSGSSISTFSNGARSVPVDEDQQFPGYQQGSWEPRFGDKENVLGVTDFTPQTGSAPTWSRVGNRVTAEAFIKVTDMTGLSSLSEIYLPECAPYPADTGYYSGFVSYVTGIQSGIINLSLNITGFSPATMPADTIIFRASTGLNSSFLKGENMLVNTAFIFSITYLTDNTDWSPKNGATIS